jgi:hypothetical protein
VLSYLDSMAGSFRDGGLSADLTHHVMHAMGSRLLGFSQELFDTSGPSGPQDPGLAARYPHIAELAATAAHDGGSTVGGCDDQFEFEFALDLLLNGFESLRRQGWTSARKGIAGTGGGD